MRPYTVVISIALVAVALGAWELFLHRAGYSWLLQTILPVLLIAVLAGLYAMARRDGEG